MAAANGVGDGIFSATYNGVSPTVFTLTNSPSYTFIRVPCLPLAEMAHRIPVQTSPR